jgi:glutamine synthetase
LQTLEPRSDGKQWDVDTLPIWNFDGSSTGQAPGENSDVYLRPCAVYPDPFRKGANILYVPEIRIHLERTALTRPSVS